MSKKRKKQKFSNDIDPNEILSGRIYVNADQLIDIIHKINPTGNDHPELKRDFLYSLKSKLQSFFIVNFKELVTVDEVPFTKGIISLKYQGRDACHAVLADLQYDARSWVNKKLDKKSFEKSGHRGINNNKPDKREQMIRSNQRSSGSSGKPYEKEDYAEKSIGELVNLGKTALMEYNYEIAHKILKLAYKKSGKSLETTISLLILLVDHLGLYQDALDYTGDLPGTVAYSDDVRLLFALAAARLSKSSRALDFLTQNSHERVAEVYIILCSDAIASNKRNNAKNYLKQATNLLSENHPDILRLSNEFSDLLRKR